MNEELSPSDPQAFDDEPVFGSPRPPPPSLDSSSCDGALYSLLNVEQDASEADIAKAYKSLAVLLHPDKHGDPRKREAAQAHFEAVHRAYEVLSDSHRRAVYDLIGEKGLTSNWEVSKFKQKSAAELRAEYQNAAWAKYSTEVESLVKSTGRSHLSIYEQTKVRRKHRPSPLDRLRYISLRQLSISHGFNVPLSVKTTAMFKAHMMQRPSQAGGNIVGTVRHHVSPKMSVELGSTFLAPRIVTGKATYAPDPDTFISFGTSARTLTAPPPWSITYGQMLLPGITTFCTFKSGVWTLASWGRDLIGDEQRSASPPAFVVGCSSGETWNGNVEAWHGGAAVSADYKLTVLGGVRISTGWSANTSGAVNATFSGERRLTTDTKLALVLALPLGNGPMTLRIRVSRLGQRFVLPIILSQTPNLQLALTLLVAPSISMTALHHLYLVPRKKRRVAKKLADLRNEHWQTLGRQREAALDAISLLVDPVNRRIASERLKPEGLVIVSATYGTEREEFDVTIPTQALVQNSMLLIPGGRSKSSLLGFYDVAIGEAKRLKLRYEFKGRAHEATYDDTASVCAPLRSHMVVESL